MNEEKKTFFFCVWFSILFVSFRLVLNTLKFGGKLQLEAQRQIAKKKDERKKKLTLNPIRFNVCVYCVCVRKEEDFDESAYQHEWDSSRALSICCAEQ